VLLREQLGALLVVAVVVMVVVVVLLLLLLLLPLLPLLLTLLLLLLLQLTLPLLLLALQAEFVNVLKELCDMSLTGSKCKGTRSRMVHMRKDYIRISAVNS